MSKRLSYTITLELEVRDSTQARLPLLRKLETAVIQAVGAVEGINRDVETVRAELWVKEDQPR